MPSDVIGHTIFDAASSSFVTRQGPVFTHLLLADEINRAPAKTQSALLEAMQETQVTLEGARRCRCRSRSWCWPRRTRSSRKAPIRCRKRSSTASCSRYCIDYPSARGGGGADAPGHRAPHRRRAGGGAGGDRWSQPQHIVSLQTATAHVEVDDRVLDYAVAIASRHARYPGIAQRRRAARQHRADPRRTGAAPAGRARHSPRRTTSRPWPCRPCAIVFPPRPMRKSRARTPMPCCACCSTRLRRRARDDSAPSAADRSPGPGSRWVCWLWSGRSCWRCGWLPAPCWRSWRCWTPFSRGGAATR